MNIIAVITVSTFQIVRYCFIFLSLYSTGKIPSFISLRMIALSVKFGVGTQLSEPSLQENLTGMRAIALWSTHAPAVVKFVTKRKKIYNFVYFRFYF